MASALKLVTERGYTRVRLADIAADAGVSKATVYHYFADKDELLTRTIAERISEKHAASEKLLALTGGSASTRLRVFLDHFWTFCLTKRAGIWQRLLVSEIVTEAPPVFKTWGRGLVLRWNTVQRLIEEGQASGEFRPEADAAVAARLIISGLWHQAFFHVHLGVNKIEPLDTGRIFESAVEQFLFALGPHSVKTTNSR